MKVMYPLMSLSASGTFAKRLVFQKNNRVYFKKKHVWKKTQKRLENNRIFSDASHLYYMINEQALNYLKEKAKKMRLNAYQLWIRYYFEYVKTGEFSDKNFPDPFS